VTDTKEEDDMKLSVEVIAVLIAVSLCVFVYLSGSTTFSHQYLKDGIRFCVYVHECDGVSREIVKMTQPWNPCPDWIGDKSLN